MEQWKVSVGYTQNDWDEIRRGKSLNEKWQKIGVLWDTKEVNRRI